MPFWGQKLHILSFFHRVKAHEVVSACWVSADVAHHHVSWAGSIARHWLCLRFCADFAESNKLKTCYVIRISWNWTCCKNSPGSRHYTLGWVPSLDSGKQCHSRIELINFDPQKKKRWTTWNLRLPDKAVATVHRLPCMDLANSGSWRGGKVQGEIWWRLWFRRPGKPLHSLCTGLVLNHPCKPRTV